MVVLKGTRQVESQGQRETKETIKNYKHLNDNSKEKWLECPIQRPKKIF